MSVFVVSCAGALFERFLGVGLGPGTAARLPLFRVPEAGPAAVGDIVRSGDVNGDKRDETRLECRMSRDAARMDEEWKRAPGM